MCSFSERLCPPGIRTGRDPSPTARGKSQPGRLGSEICTWKTRVTVKLPGLRDRGVAGPCRLPAATGHTAGDRAVDLHWGQQDAPRSKEKLLSMTSWRLPAPGTRIRVPASDLRTRTASPASQRHFSQDTSDRDDCSPVGGRKRHGA